MTEPIMGNGVPIVATQLVRNFGETVAVNQLSFKVQAGEILGIVHSNERYLCDAAKQELLSAFHWSDSPVDPLPLFYDKISRLD